MPNNGNELTVRLEPARRQFFQWHFVEKLQIVEIKDKMDQLTRDLKIAGYDFDFVAEANAWRGRSRRWNKLAKSAWKIQLCQRGRGLPVPPGAQGATLWIEWDQDVGDWRRGHVSLHAAQVAEAYRLGHPGRVIGNYEEQDERSTVMEAPDGLDASSDLPDSLSNGLTYPPISNPAELGRAYRNIDDARRAVGLQQYKNPFANIHPPMMPLIQQNGDSLPRTMDPRDMTLPSFENALKPFDNGSGSDLWNSTFSAAATSSAPRPDWKTDHNLSPLTSAIEAYRITRPTPFAPAPGSEFSGHGYQDVYGPHSWNTGSFHHHDQRQRQRQHQYQQPDIPAERGKHFDGQPWTTHQEKSPK